MEQHLYNDKMCTQTQVSNCDLVFRGGCWSRTAEISDDEWKELKFLQKSLKVFADMTCFLQGQNYPTIQQAISENNIIFDALDDLADAYPGNPAIENGFKKLKKYYTLSDDCPANFLATLLNPNLKLKYCQDHSFPVEAQNQIKKL